MAGNRWQIQNADKVRDWTREGRSARWIADQLGCSVDTVRRLRRRSGVSKSIESETRLRKAAERRADACNKATAAARSELEALREQIEQLTSDLDDARLELNEQRQATERAESIAELATARAPRGSGYSLPASSVLPWVLWVTYSDAELVRICIEQVLPSDWYGDLPIPVSAVDTIRRAWGEAHASRWQAHKRTAEREGLRASIKARLKSEGVEGQDLIDRATDEFDSEIERMIAASPWPHTHEKWRK